jgi:hypothetical protein
VSRRLVALLLLLPALALIAWLVIEQRPRWTAPEASWFPPETPGTCAAVASLALYHAERIGQTGIGRDAALEAAQRALTDHYETLAVAVGQPQPVRATLLGQAPADYYVVTAQLNDAALPTVAILYLDAASGEPRALLTASNDPALDCSLDVRAALLAAARSPALIGLVAYVGVVVIGLVAWWLLKRRKKSPVPAT